jgi:hypothetical protein
MTSFKRWLTVTRFLGLLAVCFGLIGFGITYFWVPIYLPEFRSGLLLCGLLALGGTALLASSRAARNESPASLVNVAACSAMVLTLFAATLPDVALRLWWATVIHLS